MPLIVDGEYRGAHASHVHPNQKLGKHRTVITSALPLMNWLIDDERVATISFGRLTHASGKVYSPRVVCEVVDRLITVLLVDKTSAQSIRVWVRKPEHVEQLVARITSKWASDTVGSSTLKIVKSAQHLVWPWTCVLSAPLVCTAVRVWET